MNTLKAIQSRRSVRSFKTKKPDWRDIIEAINSARYAPMAGGLFPLKFILIDDTDTIEKIAKWSDQEWIAETKYVVVFVSDTKKVTRLYEERGEKYCRQEAGAAIENFLLHLTEIGLSTCWVGHFYDDKIKTILKIPEEQEIEGIFPIGYERVKPRLKKEKGNLWKGLYFNKWGNKYMHPPKKIEGRGLAYY